MAIDKYNLNQFLFKFFTELGLNHNLAEKIVFGTGVLWVILIFLLTNLIAKKIVLKFLNSLIKKTKFTWDDKLKESGIFNQIVYMIPVIITEKTIEVFFSGYDLLLDIAHKIIDIWVLIIIINIVKKTLDLLVSNMKANSYNSIAIQGFSQMIKISIYVIGGILFFSILSDVNLKTIFASLGAIAAVLLLIFKDTILGFVSSIQIAFSKTIKVGDWVSLPQYNTDGTILEINLFSTKIQNWDKTISSVPTSIITNSSVKNWKGMEHSKVRRIKKYINIDATSIKFCNKEILHKFKQYELLKNFISQKEEEIENYNYKTNANKEFAINGRNLTNIGLFRSYAELYLKNHSQISQRETLMVRLLQPTSEGIPLEIYCFCKDTEWVNYEKIQSDILDHLLSCVPDFDLEIFQFKAMPNER